VTRAKCFALSATKNTTAEERRFNRPAHATVDDPGPGTFHDLEGNSSMLAEEPGRAWESLNRLSGMRVLIAEDETIIRLDLRALLERAGFEVCAEARDGEEAVELARSEKPDVAVLDVKMPRLDGIEAARRILDERPIPIVMLTAYGQEELVSRAVEAGVFGYLVKPFREQDLLPAIHTARARHEELAALREEADSLSEALSARKVIERAKGLLMAKEDLSEDEAFARLRKASQVSGRPLRVVAEAVLLTLGGEA
jgi:AmiR/NasT family two-component response regulator